MTSFASDNYAPAHPEVLAAITEANQGPASSYGDDPWTRRLEAAVRAEFGEATETFGVLTGTGANIISLMAASPRWGGVVASRWAHINTDENGAPEHVGGLKILPIDSPDAKLTPAAVDRYAGDLRDVHRAQPTVLSLTQATELGTVYTVAELRELTEAAHHRGMIVHLDGSRLANAAAFLDTSLGAVTTGVGIDIVSLGGTKNGALLGEAVVVPDGPHRAELADAVGYLRKITAQLASKQRFVSAQLLALLSGDVPLWLRNAQRANDMARMLAERVSSLAGLTITQAVEANAVFAVLPRSAAETLRETYHFYDWAPGPTPDHTEVRWMCAWNTPVHEVELFAADIAQALEV